MDGLNVPSLLFGAALGVLGAAVADYASASYHDLQIASLIEDLDHAQLMLSEAKAKGEADWIINDELAKALEQSEHVNASLWQEIRGLKALGEIE